MRSCAVQPSGYTRDGELVLLVVDGRRAESRGVDLDGLAAIMRGDLGCYCTVP